MALDKATGKELWKTRRESAAKKNFSFSTPLLIEVHGQKQVISPGSEAVCAYDPASGREIWRVRYNGYSVVPRPVYGHGLVFISTGFDHPEVMAVRPDGRGDVTQTHVAWTASRGAPNTPSLLLVGDELYLVSDAEKCELPRSENRQGTLAGTSRRRIVWHRRCSPMAGFTSRTNKVLES